MKVNVRHGDKLVTVDGSPRMFVLQQPWSISQSSYSIGKDFPPSSVANCSMEDEEAKHCQKLSISWKYANSRYPTPSMLEPLRKCGTKPLHVKVHGFALS